MTLQPMLRLTASWSADDMLDLTVYACDGKSCFETNIYVGDSQLKDAAAGLLRFGQRVYGVFDLELGKFGPEFAAGALHARLQFQQRGGLNVTLRMQSDFVEFAGRPVASAATLYLTADLGMLDNFVRALGTLADGACDEAQLDARGIV